MSDTTTITLAGQQYTIRKLTLRQIRDLRIGIARFATQEGESKEPEDWAASVVAEALSRDHKDMTVDAILDLEVTPKEISDASTAVLKFAGFVKKEVTPGEATPETASTGPTS